MLAKLGYQPGQGLGKSVVGRAEPIGLDLKQNRLGLGAVSKRAAQREAQQQHETEAAGVGGGMQGACRLLGPQKNVCCGRVAGAWDLDRKRSKGSG